MSQQEDTNMKNEKLYLEALEIRAAYRRGVITRAEAKKAIKPYEDMFNKISEEKAAKYKVRPQRFKFDAFMR